jgi:thiamine-monophosphate kinase
VPPGTDNPPDNLPLGEFGRIDRFFKPLAAGYPGALGLPDDAAVVAVPAGRELVVTTDALVAGIHYLPDDPPGDIAIKLLGVNLSDLAAMAAEPLGYTLITALPHSLGDDWLTAFAAGLAEGQRRYGIHLLGGDSVSTPGPAMLSVTAFGMVPAGQALTRRAARTDDALFVTGTIGDAALGLAVLQNRLTVTDSQHHAFLVDRYRRPRPRLNAVPLLRRFAGAGLDISDGLIADLGHICEVSGCGAVVNADRVPLSAAGRAVVAAAPGRLETVLTGGDDYEILFTAAPENCDALLAAAAEVGFAVTEVGYLTADSAQGIRVQDAAGQVIPLTGRGWTHF